VFAPTFTGHTEEHKVATVRTSPGCQQFPVGDVFTANGQPGEIVRINKNGTIYGPAANNPGIGANQSWVKLPGEAEILRGSLYVDRFCAFGGDLIVVTGNEGNTGGGTVWRVKLNGTAQLLATILDPDIPDNTTIGVHLEGVITLPNIPKYGLWAGKIIAGNEHHNGDHSLDGRIYSIDAAGNVAVFAMGFTDGNGLHHPVKPEDLDLIESESDFFGVNFGDSRILTAAAADFTSFVGDILVTQEFPEAGTTGLYVVHWDTATTFHTTLLNFSLTSPVTSISQWEHVTFAPAPQLETVTQGGWGAKPSGDNPGMLLKNNFSTVYPSGVSIGDSGVGCFKLTFTTAKAIENFLPQSTTPGKLTKSATNPTSSKAGVFAGQVLALELNVDFSNAGKLPSGLASFVLISGPAAGKTVAQVLADANLALGCGTLPSYASSISALNDIVDSINELFD
jgi:hypothetical protein